MVKLTQVNGAPTAEIDFAAGKMPDSSMASIAQKLSAALAGADPATQRIVRDQLRAAREQLEVLRRSIGKSELREGMNLSGDDISATLSSIDKGRGSIVITVDSRNPQLLGAIEEGSTLSLRFNGKDWRTETLDSGRSKGKLQIVVRNFEQGAFKEPEITVEKAGSRSSRYTSRQ